MFKLALTSLLARKLRLALMLFAIVLGVSFVSASFIVSDSLGETFDKLSNDIEGRTDLTVRTTQEFGDLSQRQPIDASILDKVKRIDGVEEAAGGITVGNVIPIKANGEAVQSMGPPLFGVATTASPGLTQLLPVDGRPPQGDSEFNLDVDSAKKNDFVIGTTYSISTPTGVRKATLVGTIAFNSPANDTLGAVLTVFDMTSAQRIFGLDGKFSEIGIKVANGESAESVKERIAQILPAGAEVVGRDVKVQESQDQFGDFAAIFGNILLAFAVITVVVSSFLINNTFRIIIGQRVRELALLRALGATGSQVTWSVLGEAMFVGIAATVAGFGAGFLLAIGLRALLSAVGFSLPDGPLVVEPRTVVAAAIVGVGVTIVSALLPALKVRHIPPVAAMRDDFHLEGSGLRRRLILGGVVITIGIVLLAAGLFGGFETAPLLTALALGALATFIGVNLLSPIFAVPVARSLGAPIARLRGIPGVLARDNAARNPSRTASTAAALMIGVALISMSAVVGTSLKATFTKLLDDAVDADFYIAPKNRFDPTAGFSPSLTEAMAELPEIESVVSYRSGINAAKVDGKVKNITATDFAGMAKHVNPKVSQGDLTTAGPDGLLVHRDSAEDLALALGDTVEMTFQDGKTERLRVAAIYDDASILGNWVVGLDVWNRHFVTPLDQFVTAVATDRSNPTAAQTALKELVGSQPVEVQNRKEIQEMAEKQVDSILNVINVMLGFSLFVALLGIYNTLRLSIYERTRELGLLRAVGMSRAQMRTMIRWEAAVVAVFGAVLGVVLGVPFGIAACTALPDSFVSTVSIPWVSLVIYVLLAAVAGLAAAVFPARRAARLNILEAIAYS
jgi:putative ABC transport system permease protein